MQQAILTAVLALMVYTVALDLRLKDLLYVAQRPLPVLVGLLAQFVLLPGATFLATLALPLSPPTETAMMLVASCPGGALSNALTHWGRGNLALSLSISAVASLAALFLTPLNFTLMVSHNPETAAWVRAIEVDPRDMWISLVGILGFPMTAALLTTRFLPRVADRLRKPLGWVSMAALGVFIVGAVAAQWSVFVAELGRTLPLVVAHNGLGLALGFGASLAARLPVADTRAVVIESGMQNSGLAMGIVAAQFQGDLAMVSVAALWGIWHIVSGGTLVLLWRRAPEPKPAPAPQLSEAP